MVPDFDQRLPGVVLTASTAGVSQPTERITAMTPTNPHPNIPNPPGAKRVDDWEVRTGPDGPPTVFRCFTGAWRVVDRPQDRAIAVELGGLQHLDGRISPEVYVSAIDGPLTPAIARQLGAALIAAADEAQQMNGHEPNHGLIT
jgi:hypothetical protein